MVAIFYSYGTTIGSAYAELFPGNVGRAVLDSAQDPALTRTEVADAQLAYRESRARAYLESCLGQAGCPVTGTVDEAVFVDEAYRGKRSDESRTATGLTRPRFTDSALAWCGLWGLAAFPVVHRVRFPSTTAGHVRTGRRSEELVVPVLIGRYSVERWRAIIVSSQVPAAVGDDLTVRRNARQ